MLTLWHTSSLVLALATGLPDAHALALVADSAVVPRAVVWAVAFKETRQNLNPLIRGRLCVQQHPRTWRAVCEAGRMQLRPATARVRCPGVNILLYEHNIRCGVKILAEDGATYGWPEALRRYNGSGPMARAYRDDALRLVGLYTLRLEHAP